MKQGSIQLYMPCEGAERGAGKGAGTQSKVDWLLQTPAAIQDPVEVIAVQFLKIFISKNTYKLLTTHTKPFTDSTSPSSTLFPNSCLTLKPFSCLSLFLQGQFYCQVPGYCLLTLNTLYRCHLLQEAVFDWSGPKHPGHNYIMAPSTFYLSICLPQSTVSYLKQRPFLIFFVAQRLLQYLAQSRL